MRNAEIVRMEVICPEPRGTGCKVVESKEDVFGHETDQVQWDLPEKVLSFEGSLFNTVNHMESRQLSIFTDHRRG